LAATEGQKDGLRIAAEDLDGGQGDEAGKAVEVAELLWRWHLAIVTTFRGSGKAESPGNFQVSEISAGKIHPLDFKKSQNYSWQRLYRFNPLFVGAPR
jgi:hypothetical protein